MLTGAMITMIQRRVGNYSREEILSLMNELQEEVYQDVEQTLVLDTSTGMPPYIATTKDTYSYDCPEGCRRTAAIFTADPPRAYSRSGPIGHPKEYYFRGRGYYMLSVSSYDRQPDGTDATVVFRDNPGTTTDKYFHSYWRVVTELDTEDDQLLIPSWTHRLMRRAIIAELKSEDLGDTGKEESAIQYFSKMIRKELNRGAQSSLGYTPIRAEYQQYPNMDTGYGS